MNHAERVSVVVMDGMVSCDCLWSCTWLLMHVSWSRMQLHRSLHWAMDSWCFFFLNLVQSCYNVYSKNIYKIPATYRQCSKLNQKSCQSCCLESQIINIKLKKSFKKVPSPPPKLPASGWRTGSNLEHWYRSRILFQDGINLAYKQWLLCMLPAFISFIWKRS